MNECISEGTEVFLSLLKGYEPILLSGSIGAILYERGIFINRSFEEVNLSDPNLVARICQEFVDAGVKVLLTNTWAANACKLASFGLSGQMKSINENGVKICKDVVRNSSVLIAGVVGPLGVRIEPWGPTSLDDAKQFFKEQIKILHEQGVDLFVLESFGDLYEIQQAIRAVKEVCALPIVALMEVDEEGRSLFGTEVGWCVQKCDEWGAHVVGVTGGNGPSPLLDLIPKLKLATQKPLALYPNAGRPRLVDGRYIYMASPEYMGEFARQALLKGAYVIGGSSGTSAAHFKQMAGAIRQTRAFQSIEYKTNYTLSDSSENKNHLKIPHEQQSHWAKKIANREFVICVELLPPKGLDTEKILERSLYCKEKGIDAINIPDGPRASARMSSLATACLIEQKIGIETILHYACRDRNLLGMQSDFLGAAGLGLKNVLCVTGDPPKMGPYPNATAVFDIDAIGLVNMATRLNSGFDLGGASIGAPTCISIGVGANPVSPDMEREKSRFKYKVEAGAHWAITQPVFDEESLYRFLDFSSQFKIPVIAGIWPLKSLRNAEFMANEVPGVFVPKIILDRMAKHKDSESQMQEGIDIARELIEKIKPSVQGLQMSAPFGMVELVMKVIS